MGKKFTSVALGFALAIPLAFAVPHKALSHSGGLDANGCHGGSQPYHCHRSASDMRQTDTGNYRLRCDLGSRSRECGGGVRYEDLRSPYERPLLRDRWNDQLFR